MDSLELKLQFSPVLKYHVLHDEISASILPIISIGISGFQSQSYLELFVSITGHLHSCVLMTIIDFYEHFESLK